MRPRVFRQIVWPDPGQPFTHVSHTHGRRCFRREASLGHTHTPFFWYLSDKKKTWRYSILLRTDQKHSNDMSTAGVLVECSQRVCSPMCNFACDRLLAQMCFVNSSVRISCLCVGCMQSRSATGTRKSILHKISESEMRFIMQILWPLSRFPLHVSHLWSAPCLPPPPPSLSVPV